MVELALFTGLFAGCVVGVRGLLAILGLLVVAIPPLAVTVGLSGVLSAATAIVAVQVGYAAAALMPVGFQYLPVRLAPAR